MKKYDTELWTKRDEKIENTIKDHMDGQDGYKSVHALLMHTIRRASQSADKLATRIWWLNLILIIVGTLGLIVAACGVFYK